MNGEELSADHAWTTLRKYGRWHLARDSEDAIRARLDARAGRSGVFLASDAD